MKKKFKYFKKNLKSKKRKSILGPFAKGVVYETDNGVFALPVKDIAIGRDLGFKGSWDSDEIDILSKYINQDDTIYVVGTHVGTLLIPISKKVKQIVGYEANEDTFWYINMNLCFNKAKNVTLYNLAVGNEEKTVTFYKNTVNTGGSKIKPQKDSIMYNHDNPEEVNVQMIALDQHINSNNLPKPSGMIMDIEGAEYFALQGMQNTLKDMRFLYIEYVPHHLDNVSNTTNAEFLEVIAPHFTKAYFIRTDKEINYENNSELVLEYMNTLKSGNNADDILFSK